MRYCADTWFFIQLANNNPKALEIWQEIKDGKGRLAISTLVIAETIKQFLRKNMKKDLESLSHAFTNSEKISVVDVTKEIAEMGGKFSYYHDMPIIDSIIQATAVTMNYTNILSSDEHYKIAERQKIIKRIFW